MKGDQTTIRECYNMSPTRRMKDEALTMENLDAMNELKEVKAKPVEDLTKVRLREVKPDKAI